MRKILIVDDERHVSRVLQLALESAGYAVEVANNGEQALRRLLQAPPDALVTDIMMPRMTGRDLVDTVRHQLPHHKFPILVMTASLEHEHRKWTSDVRDLYFVEKPVSPRMLTKILAEHFAAADQCKAEDAVLESVQ
ncbi:MAG: response regulator [Thiogranum sp.]